MSARRPAGDRSAAPVTAIVSPLPAELAAVRAATAVERTATARGSGLGRGLDLAFGRLGGAPVVLAATGDGARSAAHGLAALLDATAVGRLLVLGVAGGLTPGLAPGDLVAARRTVVAGEGAREGSPETAGDPGWLAAAVACGAVAGMAVTSSRILITPAEKRAALDALAARGAAGRGASRWDGPATVDLVSAVYARLAAARGIPFLVVRAVIDAADEELPLDFNRCRREDGGVDEARVVRMALWKPQVWGTLAELRRRLRRAALGLARLTVRLVEAGAAGAAAAADAAPAAGAAAGRGR